MPGVDLNLTLPSLADKLAVAVSKLTVALSAIEDDLAAKVTPSEIDINTALSMAGNSLTSVGSVQLVAGNPPSTAGAIYYNAGEFYMRDAAGPVRITLNGALDASSLGTIGGDFGGGNPAAVTYDDISGEYRFTEDVGVWADLVCDDLVLNGSLGSVRLGVGTGIGSARQVVFESLPASGVSMLVYDASDSSLRDAAVTRATNEVRVTNIDQAGTTKHGNLSVSGPLLYGSHIITVTGTPSNGANWNGGFSTAFSYIVSGLSADYFVPIPIQLLANQRVKSVTLNYADTAYANTTLSVYRGNGPGLGGALTIIQAGTIGGGVSSQTVTLSTPTICTYGLWVRVTTNVGSTGPKLSTFTVVFDAVTY